MLKRRNSIPGFQEGGMNVDPVSGNEVPTASLPEEVRDDVDAKLSPGEFVLSADVVRFIGLERLMKMRDEAKKGIQRMAEIGQMGNADEVGEESNSTYEDDGFESEIDDILGEVENENGVDDQMKMAFGGYVGSGTDLTKAPKNPVFDVRYYKNKEGATMFITHINGKPMTPVPEGFTQVSAEEAQKVGQAADEEEKKKTATGGATDQGGYDASQLDPAVAKFLENETPAERDARMGRINTTLERITGNLPFVGAMKKGAELIFGKPRKDLAPVETRTPTPVGSIGAAPLTATADVSMAQAAANDARQRALDSDFSSDAAARAAASAAEAVNRGVDPAVAVQAAIEAEQDVIDRESVSITGSSSTSRSYTPSSTVSPTVSATSSPVTSRTVESRSLDLGTDSSMGTPESTPDPFSASFDGPAGPFGAAKGGLVSKRQYPAKKKKGKGIAASK
jgi:Arc/MetJ-type ribon-helix-helix transcriptional regulator